MQDPNKPYLVVLGIDYSKESELALAEALAIAAAKRLGEVHAVHVVDTPLGATSTPSDQPMVRLAAYLELGLSEFRERSGGAGQLPARVVGHVRFEAPATEIAQLAADLEADLVVVGTHGRRGLARAVMGSVAETVVRLAPCPVLVARPKFIAPVPRIQPPCPECVKARQESGGAAFWCEQHSERHGQRHTYHGDDRVSSDGNMPLLFHR